MPIKDIPQYQVISKEELVDTLKERTDNSSREELVEIINNFTELVDAKMLRQVLTA